MHICKNVESICIYIYIHIRKKIGAKIWAISLSKNRNMFAVRCTVCPGFRIKQDLHGEVHPYKTHLSLPAISSAVAYWGYIWD